MRVQVVVLNLLNARASDIQYYYASRSRARRRAGTDDVHFHPVEPRQIADFVRLGVVGDGCDPWLLASPATDGQRLGVTWAVPHHMLWS